MSDDRPARAKRATPPDAEDRDDGVFVRRHPPRKGFPVWAWAVVGAGALGAILIVCLAVGLVFIARQRAVVNAEAAGGLANAAPPANLEAKQNDPARFAPRPSLVGPSEANEGASWTHEDLRVYLASRGLVLRMEVKYPGGALGPSAYFKLGDGKSVYVRKMADSQTAKDSAALKGEENAFSWGRFLFSGDAELSASIARELGRL